MSEPHDNDSGSEESPTRRIITVNYHFFPQGKGERLTYFLEGEDESHRKRRLSDNISKSEDLTRSASSILSSIVEVSETFTEVDESQPNGSLPQRHSTEMSSKDSTIEDSVSYKTVINRLNCGSVFPALGNTDVMCTNFTDGHETEEKRLNWELPESPGEMEETEKLPLMTTNDAKLTVTGFKSPAEEHIL